MKRHFYLDNLQPRSFVVSRFYEDTIDNFFIELNKREFVLGVHVDDTNSYNIYFKVYDDQFTPCEIRNGKYFCSVTDLGSGAMLPEFFRRFCFELRVIYFETNLLNFYVVAELDIYSVFYPYNFNFEINHNIEE